MSSSLAEELVNAEPFVPSGASHQLIADLDEAVGEINERRPLPEDVVNQLNDEVLADRVHSSAVTEGNRLSRRETIVVLSSGIVEAGTRRDVLEVKNLAAAIVEAEDALRKGVVLSVGFLRHLHGFLMKGIDDESAGDFRRENVRISGAGVVPPQFQDIQPFLRVLFDAYSEAPTEYHPVQKAAWVHWAIARVHPFKDGNGRAARLVQDYVLLRHGYVPATLQAEDREGGYYSGLEKADRGEGKPLLEMIAKNALRTADRYLRIIRDKEAADTWIAGIAKAATEKVAQTEHRRFLQVQRSFNIAKSEFASISEELTLRIPGLCVDFKDYGSLSFEQFQEIERRGKTSRAWLFGVDFRIEQTALRYIFWYGSHRRSKWDISSEFPCKEVLLVSAEEEASYFRLLDELNEDRVSLREIVPSGSLFWRRRYDPVDGQHEWDTELTVGAIARDFFQEVLAKLGLV